MLLFLNLPAKFNYFPVSYTYPCPKRQESSSTVETISMKQQSLLAVFVIVAIISTLSTGQLFSPQSTDLNFQAVEITFDFHVHSTTLPIPPPQQISLETTFHNEYIFTQLDLLPQSTPTPTFPFVYTTRRHNDHNSAVVRLTFYGRRPNDYFGIVLMNEVQYEIGTLATISTFHNVFLTPNPSFTPQSFQALQSLMQLEQGSAATLQTQSSVFDFAKVDPSSLPFTVHSPPIPQPITISDESMSSDKFTTLSDDFDPAEAELKQLQNLDYITNFLISTLNTHLSASPSTFQFSTLSRQFEQIKSYSPNNIIIANAQHFTFSSPPSNLSPFSMSPLQAGGGLYPFIPSPTLQRWPACFTSQPTAIYQLPVHMNVSSMLGAYLYAAGTTAADTFANTFAFVKSIAEQHFWLYSPIVELQLGIAPVVTPYLTVYDTLETATYSTTSPPEVSSTNPKPFILILITRIGGGIGVSTETIRNNYDFSRFTRYLSRAFYWGLVRRSTGGSSDTAFYTGAVSYGGLHSQFTSLTPTTSTTLGNLYHAPGDVGYNYDYQGAAVCAIVNTWKSTPAAAAMDPRPAIRQVSTCGNGILEYGEECDIADTSTCSNCKFVTGKDCSEASTCCVNGVLQPLSTICNTSGSCTAQLTGSSCYPSACRYPGANAQSNDPNDFYNVYATSQANIKTNFAAKTNSTELQWTPCNFSCPTSLSPIDSTQTSVPALIGSKCVYYVPGVYEEDHTTPQKHYGFCQRALYNVTQDETPALSETSTIVLCVGGYLEPTANNQHPSNPIYQWYPKSAEFPKCDINLNPYMEWKCLETHTLKPVNNSLCPDDDYPTPTHTCSLQCKNSSNQTVECKSNNDVCIAAPSGQSGVNRQCTSAGGTFAYRTPSCLINGSTVASSRCVFPTTCTDNSQCPFSVTYSNGVTSNVQQPDVQSQLCPISSLCGVEKRTFTPTCTIGSVVVDCNDVAAVSANGGPIQRDFACQGFGACTWQILCTNIEFDSQSDPAIDQYDPCTSLRTQDCSTSSTCRAELTVTSRSTYCIATSTTFDLTTGASASDVPLTYNSSAHGTTPTTCRPADMNVAKVYTCPLIDSGCTFGLRCQAVGNQGTNTIKSECSDLLTLCPICVDETTTVLRDSTQELIVCFNEELETVYSTVSTPAHITSTRCSAVSNPDQYFQAECTIDTVTSRCIYDILCYEKAGSQAPEIATCPSLAPTCPSTCTDEDEYFVYRTIVPEQSEVVCVNRQAQTYSFIPTLESQESSRCASASNAGIYSYRCLLDGLPRCEYSLTCLDPDTATTPSPSYITCSSLDQTSQLDYYCPVPPNPLPVGRTELDYCQLQVQRDMVCSTPLDGTRYTDIADIQDHCPVYSQYFYITCPPLSIECPCQISLNNKSTGLNSGLDCSELPTFALTSLNYQPVPSTAVIQHYPVIDDDSVETTYDIVYSQQFLTISWTYTGRKSNNIQIYLYNVDQKTIVTELYPIERPTSNSVYVDPTTLRFPSTKLTSSVYLPPTSTEGLSSIVIVLAGLIQQEFNIPASDTAALNSRLLAEISTPGSTFVGVSKQFYPQNRCLRTACQHKATCEVSTNTCLVDFCWSSGCRNFYIPTSPLIPQFVLNGVNQTDARSTYVLSKLTESQLAIVNSASVEPKACTYNPFTLEVLQCSCLDPYTNTFCTSLPHCENTICQNDGYIPYTSASCATATNQGCVCRNKWTGSTCEKCSLSDVSTDASTYIADSDSVCGANSSPDARCTKCLCNHGFSRPNPYDLATLQTATEQSQVAMDSFRVLTPTASPTETAPCPCKSAYALITFKSIPTWYYRNSARRNSWAQDLFEQFGTISPDLQPLRFSIINTFSKNQLLDARAQWKALNPNAMESTLVFREQEEMVSVKIPDLLESDTSPLYLVIGMSYCPPIDDGTEHRYPYNLFQAWNSFADSFPAPTGLKLDDGDGDNNKMAGPGDRENPDENDGDIETFIDEQVENSHLLQVQPVFKPLAIDPFSEANGIDFVTQIYSPECHDEGASAPAYCPGSAGVNPTPEGLYTAGLSPTPEQPSEQNEEDSTASSSTNTTLIVILAVVFGSIVLSFFFFFLSKIPSLKCIRDRKKAAEKRKQEQELEQLHQKLQQTPAPKSTERQQSSNQPAKSKPTPAQ